MFYNLVFASVMMLIIRSQTLLYDYFIDPTTLAAVGTEEFRGIDSANSRSATSGNIS